MKLRKLLFSVLVVLIACSNDPEPEPERLISKINAFDIGNAGDASDIRVTFKLNNISRISDCRILVIPSDKSADFTKKDALKLSSNAYVNVEINSANDSYSIRLADISDVEGDLIQNNKEYVIKIMMVGDQFNQFSILESNKFRLSVDGIYNGFYKGSVCCLFLGRDPIPPKDDKFVWMELSGSRTRFIGDMLMGEANPPDIKNRFIFQVSNDTITSIELIVIDTYMQRSLVRDIEHELISCDEEIVGSGTIVGDINFRFSFDACNNSQGVTFNLTRVIPD